jgi:HK97 family phage major capsid protein
MEGINLKSFLESMEFKDKLELSEVTSSEIFRVITDNNPLIKSLSNYTSNEKKVEIISVKDNIVWDTAKEISPIIMKNVKSYINVHKLKSTFMLSYDLMRDSAFDVSKYMIDTVIRYLSPALQSAVISGTFGEAKSQGLTHGKPCKIKRSELLKNLEALSISAPTKDFVWFINVGFLNTIINLDKNIYCPATNTLLGRYVYPLVVKNDDLDSISANKFIGFLGDFSAYYLVRNNITALIKDLVTTPSYLKVTMNNYFGGQLMHDDAVNVISVED